jgi:hypothetical protein
VVLLLDHLTDIIDIEIVAAALVLLLGSTEEVEILVLTTPTGGSLYEDARFSALVVTAPAPESPFEVVVINTLALSSAAAMLHDLLDTGE